MFTNRYRYTLLLFLLTACSVTEKDWQKVASQLSTIKERDQMFRQHMDSVARVKGWQSKDIAELWEKQRVMDSTNLADLDALITRYGYPSKKNVGELSTVPFEVLRHANDSTMTTYLNLIVGAGKNGDLRMDQVATYQDRVSVAQRQPQEYGTQIWIDFIDNKKTGARYDSVYLWPIRNPDGVEARRAAVGLDSLSAQLRHLGIDPAKGYFLRGPGQSKTN